MLEIENLSKGFGDMMVVNNLSISVEQGNVLSVLGKSGCGKTTLLRIIAGLVDPDAGLLKLDGSVVNDVPAHLRQMVYLYQEPLLFPHLNVYENIAFGLRLRKEKDGIVKEKVMHMLGELELSGQERKAPAQLSGGQRQRVSFGRALVLHPRVLLLDEPFGALDAQTRGAMQSFFQRVAAEHRITAIFVTHDVKEALIIGDRFGLMQAGKLAVYESREAFVADPQTGVGTELQFWQNLRQPGEVFFVN